MRWKKPTAILAWASGLVGGKASLAWPKKGGSTYMEVLRNWHDVVSIQG